MHEPLNSTGDDSASPTNAGPVHSSEGMTREREDALLEAQCWTPPQALKSGYFIANVIIAGCINFGINGGINYALMHKYDYGGLWEIPRTPNAYTSVLALDMFLTSFLVVFFTTVAICGGVQGEVKKGTIRPVTGASLRDSNWRYFPTRFKNPWLRGFLGACQFTVVYYGFTLLLMATVCLAGGMGGEGNVCAVKTSVYPWVKGCWALVLAVIAWPSAFLGHLNKDNLPQDVYDVFLGRQKVERPDLFIVHTQAVHSINVGGAVGGETGSGSVNGSGYVPVVTGEPGETGATIATMPGARPQPPQIKRDRKYYERKLREN